MNVFLNVCVTGSSLRRFRHAVQQVSWRRRGEASGSVFMLTRFIQSADSLLTYWRLSRLKVWVPRCVKDVVLCKTQDLLLQRSSDLQMLFTPARKRARPHVQGFSSKSFLCVLIFCTHLTSLQVTETELFLKLLSWWRNCFQFCLLDGNKQFLERWCRHAHVYQCL